MTPEVTPLGHVGPDTTALIPTAANSRIPMATWISAPGKGCIPFAIRIQKVPGKGIEPYCDGEISLCFLELRAGDPIGDPSCRSPLVRQRGRTLTFTGRRLPAPTDIYGI